MCMALEFLAAEALPSERFSDAALDEMHRTWLDLNAAKPVPDPVCRVCNMPHDELDTHPVIEGTCESCGGNILERLTLNFVFARNKRARRRAAAALRALAYESR